MKPVYKIEVWKPGATSALYSLSNDAFNIYIKEIVTDGIGNFSFWLPTKKNGSNYYYTDIDINDKVKIWIGYDTVPADPTWVFIGKIRRIYAPFPEEIGYVRQISGLSQGEILRRRFKKSRKWDAIGASTIVKELAQDLGIYDVNKIDTDTTPETLSVTTESFFDVLRRVSDYWYDGSTKVQKDFYVDIENELVWKARPFRTTGVKTFTVGDNVLGYSVIRDIDAKKSNIVVFGKQEKMHPSDGDAWTEVLTNWTSDGTLTLDTSAKAGTYSIKSNKTGGTTTLDVKRTFDSIAIPNDAQIHYWITSTVPAPNDYRKLRILAPDESNYFEATFTTAIIDLWTEITQNIGLNTTSNWTQLGAPTWSNVQGLKWVFGWTDSWDPVRMYIDNLYFNKLRYQGKASDATYDQRDLEVTDDRLTSDTECDKRAEALLMQKKDLPIQIEIITAGDTNILVGDRVPITIPAEAITAQNYDITTFEHLFSKEFTSKTTMVNTPNIRTKLKTTMLTNIIELQRKLRYLANEERIIM